MTCVAQVLWERPLPWEGWALYRLGRLVWPPRPTAGHWPATGRANSIHLPDASGDPNDVFTLDPAGVPLRVGRRVPI